MQNMKWKISPKIGYFLSVILFIILSHHALYSSSKSKSVYNSNSEYNLLKLMSEISSMIILIDSWDFWWNMRGYRYEKYLPLETIDDLLDQYNYVGFNDLCIYPHDYDMAFYKNPRRKETKGIAGVYHGHTTQNQTGK